jgi:uncharacterized membrane protein
MPITLAIAGCLVLAALAALLGWRRGDRRWFAVAAVLAVAACLAAVAIAVGLSTM